MANFMGILDAFLVSIAVVYVAQRSTGNIRGIRTRGVRFQQDFQNKRIGVAGTRRKIGQERRWDKQ